MEKKQIGSLIGTGLGGILSIATGGAATPLIPLFSALGSNVGSKFAKYGIEVENEEVALRNNGQHINFKGATHEQGGIQYVPSKKEFIYSNSIGYDKNRKLTFDNFKDSIASKAKKLADKDGDDIARNTLSVLKKDNQVMANMLYKYGGQYAKFGFPITPITPLVKNINTDLDRRQGFPLKVDVPGLNKPPSIALTKDGGNLGAEKITATTPLNLDKLQMASFVAKGLGVGANFLKGLQPAEIEKENLNSERNTINQLVSSSRINNTALDNSFNQSRNAALQTVSRRSPQVQSALMANIDSNFALKRGELNISRDQLNNQYKFQEAQIRGQLGSEAKIEKQRVNEVDSQNRAARSNLIGAGFTGLSSLGTIGSQYAANQAEIRTMLSVIGDRYRSFGLDDELMKRIMNGTYTQQDFIKFKQAANQQK